MPGGYFGVEFCFASAFTGRFEATVMPQLVCIGLLSILASPIYAQWLTGEPLCKRKFCLADDIDAKANQSLTQDEQVLVRT